MFLQITVSYIGTRGLRNGHGGEDVYRGRAGDCVRHGSQCGVWGDLLDHADAVK